MVSYNKLSVYLAEELYQVFITYQKQQKFDTASDAMVEILSQFFQKDNEVKRYATVEQFKTLENQVTHLSQQVAQLGKILASSTPNDVSRTIFVDNIDYTIESNSFEDAEDEPDEILYDFLEH